MKRIGFVLFGFIILFVFVGALLPYFAQPLRAGAVEIHNNLHEPITVVLTPIGIEAEDRRREVAVPADRTELLFVRDFVHEASEKTFVFPYDYEIAYTVETDGRRESVNGSTLLGPDERKGGIRLFISKNGIRIK